MYPSLRSVPDVISPFSWVYLLVTWGHSGRIKPMSGTWGSLAAMPFCLIMAAYGGAWTLLFFSLTFFIVGFIAIGRYNRLTLLKDPSEIVIDEVVGMAVMASLMPSFMPLWMWAIAFLIFRVCDMIKIGPVGWCDKHLPGALGVMMDDVVAGIFAAGIMHVIFYAFHLSF